MFIDRNSCSAEYRPCDGSLERSGGNRAAKPVGVHSTEKESHYCEDFRFGRAALRASAPPREKNSSQADLKATVFLTRRREARGGCLPPSSTKGPYLDFFFSPLSYAFFLLRAQCTHWIDTRCTQCRNRRCCHCNRSENDDRRCKYFAVARRDVVQHVLHHTSACECEQHA